MCYSRLNGILWDSCQAVLCPAYALATWTGNGLPRTIENPTLQECGDVVYWDNPIPAYTWQYCNYEPL